MTTPEQGPVFDDGTQIGFQGQQYGQQYGQQPGGYGQPGQPGGPPPQW